MIFDGPGENEDFGLEQVTANAGDRYKFRSSPLRNVALQPAFFHNGAFTRLEDAIRHHLNVPESARAYDPRRAGVAADLAFALGPIEPVLATLDPLLATPIDLSDPEFDDLLSFVRNGLLDDRAAEFSMRSDSRSRAERSTVARLRRLPLASRGVPKGCPNKPRAGD